MNRNLAFILLLVLLVSAYSCTSNQKNKLLSITVIEDVSLNDIPFSASQIQTKLDTNQSAYSYFSFFNPDDNALGIAYIEESRTQYITMPLKFMNKRRSSADFYVRSFDSIFYFDRDLSGIFLFDTSGKIIDQFSIDPAYPPNPLTSHFFTFSDALYYSWIPKTDMSSRVNRKYTFETTPPICKVELNHSAQSSGSPMLFGTYPDSYKTEKDYYNYSPNIFIGLQNEIINSYESSHHLFIYKDSTLFAEKICRSNFIEEFKDIPEEKASDLSYSQKFIGEEPRYTKLIADPFRNCYYRAVKLRMKTDGLSLKDAKWSIIVLNADFDVIGEAAMPYADYMPDIIVPSRKGVYIKRSPKSKEEFYGDLKLSLIQFEL